MRRHAGGVAVLGVALLVSFPSTAWALRWVVSPTPPSTDDQQSLRAVSGAAPGDAWAVGVRVTNLAGGYGGDWHPLILHRADGSWTRVHGARVHRGSSLAMLNDVAAASPSDAWTVGIDLATHTDAMLEHWDGTSWHLYPTRGLKERLNAIARIPGTRRFALVGGFLGGRQVFAMLHHHVWTFQRIPTPHGQGIQITSVAAFSPNDVWVLGSNSVVDEVEASPGVAFAARWDGSGWTAAQLPPFGEDSPAITDAAVVPGTTEAWAVGVRLLASGAAVPLVLHLQDGSWSLAHMPPLGEPATLSGVVARGPGDVWVSGWLFNGTRATTLVMHLHQGAWVRVPSPSTSGSDRLWDIGSTGGQLWTVGDVTTTANDAESPMTVLVMRRHR